MTEQLVQRPLAAAGGRQRADSTVSTATATAKGAGIAAGGVPPEAAVGSAATQVPLSKRQRLASQGPATGPEASAAPASAAGVHAAQVEAELRQNVCPLPMRYLRGRDTTWQAADAKPTLNVRLDGRIVQSAASGARIAYSHIVVLDDFIDETTRAELLAFLTAPAAGSPGSASAKAASASDTLQAAAGEGVAGDAAGLPGDRWERQTADQAGLAATWGVKVQQALAPEFDPHQCHELLYINCSGPVRSTHAQMFVLQEHVLRQLASGELPAVQEVHARLLRLYDDVDIAHMPSNLIQGQPPQRAPSTSAAALAADDGDGERLADCDQFVANAAMSGDTFAWHIDADPAGATSHFHAHIDVCSRLHMSVFCC